MKEKNKKLINKLFEDEENAQIMDADILDKLSGYYNKKEIRTIKKGINKKYKCKKDFSSYYKLNECIQYLTTKELQYDEEEIIDDINNIDIVKKVEVLGEKSYRINTSKGKIEFSTIDSIKSKNTKINNIELEKYFKNIQSLATRTGKSYNYSVEASNIFSKYYELKNQIVTGYIYTNNEKGKYLHSWIEFEVNGKPVVLDSELNVIMNKKGYYLLNHINEKEILSKIDSENIVQDLEKYKSVIGNEIDFRIYLTSRDEVIRDLNKNPQLFNKNDGEER